MERRGWIMRALTLLLHYVSTAIGRLPHWAGDVCFIRGNDNSRMTIIVTQILVKE